MAVVNGTGISTTNKKTTTTTANKNLPSYASPTSGLVNNKLNNTYTNTQNNINNINNALNNVLTTSKAPYSQSANQTAKNNLTQAVQNASLNGNASTSTASASANNLVNQAQSNYNNTGSYYNTTPAAANTVANNTVSSAYNNYSAQQSAAQQQAAIQRQNYINALQNYQTQAVNKVKSNIAASTNNLQNPLNNYTNNVKTNLALNKEKLAQTAAANAKAQTALASRNDMWSKLVKAISSKTKDDKTNNQLVPDINLMTNAGANYFANTEEYAGGLKQNYILNPNAGPYKLLNDYGSGRFVSDGTNNGGGRDNVTRGIDGNNEKYFQGTFNDPFNNFNTNPVVASKTPTGPGYDSYSTINVNVSPAAMLRNIADTAAGVSVNIDDNGNATTRKKTDSEIYNTNNVTAQDARMAAEARRAAEGSSALLARSSEDYNNQLLDLLNQRRDFYDARNLELANNSMYKNLPTVTGDDMAASAYYGYIEPAKQAYANSDTSIVPYATPTNGMSTNTGTGGGITAASTPQQTVNIADSLVPLGGEISGSGGSGYSDMFNWYYPSDAWQDTSNVLMDQYGANNLSGITNALLNQYDPLIADAKVDAMKVTDDAIYKNEISDYNTLMRALNDSKMSGLTSNAMLGAQMAGNYQAVADQNDQMRQTADTNLQNKLNYWKELNEYRLGAPNTATQILQNAMDAYSNIGGNAVYGQNAAGNSGIATAYAADKDYASTLASAAAQIQASQAYASSGSGSSGSSGSSSSSSSSSTDVKDMTYQEAYNSYASATTESEIKYWAGICEQISGYNPVTEADTINNSQYTLDDVDPARGAQKEAIYELALKHFGDKQKAINYTVNYLNNKSRLAYFFASKDSEGLLDNVERDLKSLSGKAYANATTGKQ